MTKKSGWGNNNEPVRFYNVIILLGSKASFL